MIKEAPEKLYIENYKEHLDSIKFEAYPKRNFGDDIEYTRTDAFIEKAEEFLIGRFKVEDYNDNIDIDGTPIFNYERFFDDFRKQMKVLTIIEHVPTGKMFMSKNRVVECPFGKNRKLKQFDSAYKVCDGCPDNLGGHQNSQEELNRCYYEKK